MAPDDEISIRLRLRDAARFSAETRKAAGSVDNLGDQARQAARALRELNRASSNARLNMGPLSVRARTGVLAFGALAIATKSATSTILSLGEAAVTVGAGGIAAGGVGLGALAQGAGTVTLGLAGMKEALGGNKTALKQLAPEVRSLFTILDQAQKRLSGTSRSRMLPGLATGAQHAMRNLPVLNRVVGDTASAIGGLATNAGTMAGSSAWGADLATVGARNVRIINLLGDGALHLADAGRHVIVEAGPLAEWLATVADRGALAADSFLEAKRQTGELSAFFRRARTDIALLGSIGGHGGRGLINLFGARDVDGTRTLRNVDRIFARFERWSNSPAAQRGVGQAVIDQIPNLAGPAAVAIADMLGRAAPEAARLFWESFWNASAEGKGIIGGVAFAKLGGFKLLGKALGRGGTDGAVRTLAARGASPANPMWVALVNDVPNAPGVPGRRGGRAPGGSWLKYALPTLGAAGGAAAAAIAYDELARRLDPTGQTPLKPGGKTAAGYANTPAGRTIARTRARYDTLHVHVHLSGRQIYDEVSRIAEDDRALKSRFGPNG